MTIRMTIEIGKVVEDQIQKKFRWEIIYSPALWTSSDLRLLTSDFGLGSQKLFYDHQDDYRDRQR